MGEEEKVGQLQGFKVVLVKIWLEKTVTLHHTDKGKEMLRQVLLFEKWKKCLQKASQWEKEWVGCLQGLKVVLVTNWLENTVTLYIKVLKGEKKCFGTGASY